MEHTNTCTTGLEARAYTDPAVFQAEQHGVLARTWQFACHVSQLEQPGDFVEFEIAGESLFCVRGDSGELRAFYNVCQHRAHELLKGAGNARKLVCPYHGWTYELDGRLRSGPHLDRVPGFDRAGIYLRSVPVEEFCGFLFANLDPQASPMDEWYPGLSTELAAWVPDLARLQPLLSQEIDLRCNWKVAIENYSECYHCQKNHITYATGVASLDAYAIQAQGHCLRHRTESQNPEQMSYPIDPHAHEHAGGVVTWYLWPLFSFQVYPGNILNTYQWTAGSVDKVVLRRVWYTADGEASAVIDALARQDRDTTVAEDVRLVESVQRGLHSRGFTPGPLVIDPAGGTNSEHALLHLQRWLREAEASASELNAGK